MPYEKSVEQYRRDIFGLKNKIKQEKQYLQELKQKFSDLNVLGQDKSYSFSMKLKILQYNLLSVKQKMQQYQKDDAFQIYALNFSTLALIKATEVFSINKQMIFRAVDTKNTGKVSFQKFQTFLRQTLRLNQQFINPIITVLDPQSKTQITKQRYTKYLQSFLINSQQDNKQITSIDQSCQTIAKIMIIQKIRPGQIWNMRQLNVAILVHGLMQKVTKLDVLDCIGLYCKIDPMKKGYAFTQDVTNFLQSKITHVKNFGEKNFKLQK